MSSSDSFPFTLPASPIATRAADPTTLFQELRKPMLRYLRCLGLSAEDAQDVVQDAFLRLHQHLESGGSKDNIRGWLFRVAHNQARNRQKAYERRFGAPLQDGADAASSDSTPEQRVLKKEKFQRLGTAVQSLAETERECLMLRAEGLRYREIGEALGLATSTVGETVERAIKKLAEKCNV